MSDKIIIIGSGVSGITTALTLQLLGYETEIITAKVPTEIANKNAHPDFASLFPSASIIPHSVYSHRLEELFKLSQSFFYELRKQVFPGLTINKHFEIFEFEPDQPNYCEWMLNLELIDNLPDDTIPRRSDDKSLNGWVFDCVFADWSLYFPALIALYQQSGGTITKQKLARKDISNLSSEVIINCSGAGGPLLFEDPSENQLIMRGHLLHKANAPLITNSADEITSYNYTPQPDVYSDAEGNTCDVYCYPRKDGWILGGSRQVGELKKSNTWESLNDSSTYTIDGIQFPQEIISLNNEILSYTYDHSFEVSDDITPSVGYRYIRNRKNGLRLHQENVSGKTVYHNYGHGGAGVTLSWGCALEITHEITTKKTKELKTELLKNISKIDMKKLS
ncbi:FAD-dependent oxidoreductase [Fodinibius sp.]|uniref:FAD-dependent oxidoreductase n=1 Tax=Fodinibius sp. TaxID=1872440 RepID=UPI002ACE0CE6|nr:FAD-dependent oxidoreductase [Fodinibius sp.]MDZ7659305.1 FAD-dependent oxidoreductase [Fodinibius sp.]